MPRSVEVGSGGLAVLRRDRVDRDRCGLLLDRDRVEPNEQWVERRRFDERGEPSRDPMVRRKSRSGWTLVGHDGRTLDVDGGRLFVHKGDKVVDRFDRPTPGSAESSRGTIGYERKEWILRSGTVVHVLGEVHDRHGGLTIGPPDSAPHVEVSTSAKHDRVSGGHGVKGWSARIGLVLAVVGLALTLGTVLLG
ncbi:E3 ubiquitin ligase [Pseudonocardia sediminis]|uniref:RING-type E3 ubiquitin transferase n=1 Tax=Pseudonocardia sediminis TaxID=1397368 RepID=A0A4Q7V407_PSEST|nr:E3 ubiquitin ligase [Pseudonocardia sediminis]